MANITEILGRVRAGDSSASDELMQAVYAELHRIATLHLRKERPDHTLQPTALVNEAYVKMFADAHPEFADRVHFLAFASRIMRNILVDHARSKASAKRGAQAQRLEPYTGFEIAADGGNNSVVDLLDLDSALQELARDHGFAAQSVEMRYFGGMTAQETSEAVGRSIHIVQHELRFAHAWLRRRLAVEESPAAQP